MGGASIELKGVRRAFGTVRAVDGVSLSISAGEFFTLLGPSGSGKTTLLHLVAGFYPLDAGEIFRDGQEISNLPPFRRGIGVIFQSYALFPHMTVYENVAFPLWVRKIPRAEIATRVQDALALVQLGEYGQRRISQMSGGQQQRVAFARAVVFGPRLLLMDEPLSALDAKLRKAMRSEIKALQRRLGVTVVYVTHDQDEALALSDRIAVMRSGRVEQVATPSDLYERPASRFVADFVGDANLIDAQVVERDEAGFVLLEAGGHKLRGHCSSAIQPTDRVHLALRPERLMLNPRDPLANMVPGTVMGALYGGDHSVITVDIGEGIRLKVTVDGQQGGLPDAGTPVTVGWDSRAALVLIE